MTHAKILILGGGMTGLAAGIASGFPVFEAQETPGGICASYYMVPGETKSLSAPPSDGEAYRFEIGGGHWIWGGDPMVLRFIRSVTPFQSYARRATVYLPDEALFVPYPIQNHLHKLGAERITQILRELVGSGISQGATTTLGDWLKSNFGPTLYDLFFGPFHDLYTAGLTHHIAPQDASKSPLQLSQVIQGAFDHTIPTAGYNTNFLYPPEGLNSLAQGMANQCDMQYGHVVQRIDLKEKVVVFADGKAQPYTDLLCTLPLNRMLNFTGLTIADKPDPYTSVLVVNIGAKKGPRCPTEHWVYIPKSQSGFHRVGFYSNVDPLFLPKSARGLADRCSIYVERAYPGGQKQTASEIEMFCDAVTQELQQWGWIDEVEVLHPTWIDAAYTWAWPNSQWRNKAVAALEAHQIYQVGRYARWAFQVTDQGVLHSIRDGLMAGASFRRGDALSLGSNG